MNSFWIIQEQLPERPKGNKNGSFDGMVESFQLWSDSGESCPEGTIPIRRTTEKDILRANSLRRFGRKKIRSVRRDTMSSDHEVSSILRFKILLSGGFFFFLLKMVTLGRSLRLKMTLQQSFKKGV